MSKIISGECAVETTEEKYTFGKPMSKKYVFGVTNAVGASAVYKPEQLAVPHVSSGDQEGKFKNAERTSDEIQKTEAPRVVAKSKESAKSTFDYSIQIARLKEARDENQRSKNAQKLAERKETAKIAARASLEMKQREHVEVAARTLSFLEEQPALMNKIVKEVKASLREYYAKQMREEIDAEYAKTAAAHKEEVKAELIRQLTPEIVASVKAQYEAQAKDEVTKPEQGKKRALVDAVEEAPSSAVKRSFKKAFDKVDDGGSSPKRGRISWYGEKEEGGESGQGVEEEGTGRSEAVAPEAATPPSSSSALRGVKRKYDEDDYSEGSPKGARISGWESEDGEGDGRTEEKGWGGVDTRGPSKEDPKSETEAIAPKVATPVARRGPFLEVSDDDEGVAEAERFLSEAFGPRPASTGQDAQVKSSVGGKEHPDSESGSGDDEEEEL